MIWIQPKNVFWWCQNSTRARSVCPRVDKNGFPNHVLSVFDSLGSEKGRTGRESPPVTCTKDVPGSAKPGSLLRWPWAHAPAEQTQPHCWAHTHVQAQPNPIICLALSFFFFPFHFSSAYSATFPQYIWAALPGWTRLTSAPLWLPSLLYFPRVNIPLLVSFISQPLACFFLPQNLWRDSRYPFCWIGEPPKSTWRGCVPLDHGPVDTESGQRTFLSEKFSPCEHERMHFDFLAQLWPSVVAVVEGVLPVSDVRQGELGRHPPFFPKMT